MIRCSFFRSRLLLSCLALEVMVLSPFGAVYGGDGWRQDEQTGLEMRMVARDVNGGAESEHRLELRTHAGVIHVVERSSDLHNWLEVGQVYGFGQEFAVPVVRTGVGGDAGVIPEDDTPPPSYAEPGWQAFVMMRRVAAEAGGGIWVAWQALDGDGMRGMVVPDVIMPDDRGLSFSLGEWGEVQAGYSGGEPLAMVPSVLEPSGLDTAVASRIIADFPAWAAAVMDYIETAVPVRVEGTGGERRFFRVRTITNLDSDFDSVLDVEEWANGTNPFSPDSDGDGISDAMEKELGTDPNGHAAVTDSDGDGLMDDEDAAPGDSSISWRVTPEASYVVLDLGALNVPNDAGEALDLSEAGHVLFEQGVWHAGSWTGLNRDLVTVVEYPDQSDPVADFSPYPEYVDGVGRVFGYGTGQTGSGGDWAGAVLWDSTASSATIIGEADYLNEVRGYHLFSRPNRHGVVIPDGRERLVARVDEWDATPSYGHDLVIFDAIGQTPSALPGKWFDFAAITSSGELIGTQIDADGVLSGTVITVDGNLEVMPGIGGVIGGSSTPDGGLWVTGLDSQWAGKVLVRHAEEEGGSAQWEVSTSFTDVQPHILNARGEALSGGKIWRNAQWKNLDERVASSGWSGLEGIDMNDSGMVLATGFRVDVNGAASTTREAVLLVPVELNVFPPKPTEKLLLENQSFEDRWELTEHYISADDSEMWVTATVYVPGFTDEGVPTMVPAEDGTTVNWEIVEGTGGSLSSTSSETETGMAAVKLTTSTEPEARFVVKATIESLGMTLPNGGTLSVSGGTHLEEMSQDIVVFPGEPATMTAELKRDGQTATSMPADEASEMEVTVELKDSHGNPVAQGTRVYWMLRGMGEIVEMQELVEGEDGKATATVRAGDIAETQKLVVQAENLQQEVEINNTAVEASLTSSASILELGSSSVTLTLSAPEVADGAPVSWDVSQGELSSVDDEITNGGASATLAVNEGAAGKVVAIARVGDKVTNLSLDLNGRAGKPEITVEHPVIAWDLDEEGVEVVALLEGADEMVAVHAAAVVKVKDPTRAGQLLDVSVTGSSVSENHRFRFDAEDAGTTPDAHTTLVATLSDGAFIDSDSPREGAGALSLPNTLAQATISHAPGLSLDADTLISLAVKSDGSAGTILEKAGEYKLELNAGGFPVLTVGNAGAQTVVTSTVPMVPGMWHKLGISRDQGAWVLTVDGVREVETGPELSAATNAAVVVGGAVCVIDELVYAQRTSSLAGGLQADVAGLDASGKLQLDANGEGQFTVGAAVPPGQEPNERVIQPLDITVSAADGTSETAEAAVVVTDKRSVAVITLIGKHVSVSAFTEQTNPEHGERMSHGILRRAGFDPTGAVPEDAGGTAGQRAELGYSLAVWLEEESDEAGDVRYNMRLLADNVPEEIRKVLMVLISNQLMEAALQGDLISFDSWMLNRSGELKTALRALGEGDVEKFAVLAGALDSEETYTSASLLAEATDGEAITDFFNSLFASSDRGMEYLRQDLNARLRPKVPESGEVRYSYIRSLSDVQKDAMRGLSKLAGFVEPHAEQAVAGIDESILPPQTKAFVGWAFGVFDVVNQNGQGMIHLPEMRMVATEFTGFLYDAAKDEPGARDTLNLLARSYVEDGIVHLETTNADWKAERYFEAGRKSVEPALLGGTLAAGAAVRADTARKAAKKLGRELTEIRRLMATTAKREGVLKRLGRVVAHVVGRRGEKEVARKLVQMGYKDPLPIVQPGTGNGIDYICWDKDGVGVVVVEVKSHIGVGSPKLNDLQRLGPEKYAKTQLDRAINGKWYEGNVEMEKLIRDFSDAIGDEVPVKAWVMEPHFALTGSPIITFRLYKEGPSVGGPVIPDPGE